MTMKSDMGGAAAVLARCQRIARLGVRGRVTAIAPPPRTCRADATKPGDVLTIRTARPSRC